MAQLASEPQGRGRAGRPRGSLPAPQSRLTERVRLLVDRAHFENVAEASRLTGLPYPTLRDLYLGRVVNPSLRTLETLCHPYGVTVGWLTEVGAPQEVPALGWVGFLPPRASAGSQSRTLREVLIPYAAWPAYRVFSALADGLQAVPPDPARPIVGEAVGAAFVFRLTTFLLQPLLAAEKLGNERLIVPLGDYSGADGVPTAAAVPWVRALNGLGELWDEVLPTSVWRGA